MSHPHRTPADPEIFAGQVSAALGAFGHDVSYAVAMARAAVAIARKRAVWAARREIRAAQTRAVAECASTPAFDCTAVAACGTGDCKFAHDHLAQLAVPAAAGAYHRPQPHISCATYSTDEAVLALAERHPGR